MSESAPVDVKHVAQLARLNLTAEETDLFQAQLGRVLEYAEKLKKLDTTGIEAAAHAVPLFDVVREDEPQAELAAEEALRNAPLQTNGLFIVTKVVE